MYSLALIVWSYSSSYFIMRNVLVFCIVHQVHPHLSLTHCTIISSLDPSWLSNLVLLGDINVMLIIYIPCHHLYSKVQCILSTFSLFQVVTEHTHLGPHGTSLIDQVLLSQPSQLLRCTIPPLGNSDHYGIYIALKWRVFKKNVISNSR